MRVYKQYVDESEEIEISTDRAVADLERSGYYKKGTVQEIECQLQPDQEETAVEISGYRTPFSYYRFTR